MNFSKIARPAPYDPAKTSKLNDLRIEYGHAMEAAKTEPDPTKAAELRTMANDILFPEIHAEGFRVYGTIVVEAAETAA